MPVPAVMKRPQRAGSHVSITRLRAQNLGQTYWAFLKKPRSDWSSAGTALVGTRSPVEGSNVTSLFSLQERVATLMQGGASLDRVETEVIAPSDLDSEQKAALWLYAWSFLHGREQRAEAAHFLIAIGD